MELLVDVDWLNKNLSNVTVIDATTVFDPAEPSNQVQAGRSRDAYESGHIPGAVHADLMYRLAKQDTDLHCIALESDDFQAQARALGINNDDHIVVYDQGAMMWATRLWWNLRLEGHNQVSVLDGGLEAWKEAGYPLEADTPTPARGDFTACRRPELYATAEDMLDEPHKLLINALPRGQFEQGHIPGSVSIPFTESLQADGTPSEAYEQAGALDEDREVITYCGGGIAATYDAFQLARLGRDNVRVYDGSMTDWTSDPSREVAQP